MCVPASTPTVMVGRAHTREWICVSVLLVHPLTPLCFISDGAQSGAQFPSRATEAVWPQWQGQQHSQSNAEQHPHAQGHQQDMFPVSYTSLISLSGTFFILSLSDKLNFFVSLIWFRMCCLCWTSLPTSTAMTLRFPSTLRLMSDLVRTSLLVYPCCLFNCFCPQFFLYLALLLLRVALFPCFAWLKLHCHKPAEDGGVYLTADIQGREIKDLLLNKRWLF